MSAPRWIEHVTLQTGDARRSPRSEVAERVIAGLRPLLTRALQGEQVGVPGFPGYTFTGGVHGRCCVVTVSAVVPDTVAPDRMPLVSCAVAPHSRCGAYAWRALHEMAERAGAGPLRSRADQVPPEPWLGVLLLPGLALYPEAAHWLGDFERCAAWTWIAMEGAE